MIKTNIFSVLFLTMVSVLSAQDLSPFGVCMHLDAGDERIKMPNNIQMARDAGIRWARFGFVRGYVQSREGIWRFDILDRALEESEKKGLNLLPILASEVSWARPAYKHLDLYLEYVEKVVTRYKGRIQCWEVWNEPNLYPRFWSQPDDWENYTLLLKAAYHKIKEIDPKAVVVYGGTSGIPMSYIEKSFAAGAVDAFDKMAVHPYRLVIKSWEATLQFKDDIDRLRALMAKYDAGDKGIWFTEMGTSTMTGVATRGNDVFHKLKAETGQDWNVAVVCDDEFPVDPSFTATTLRSFFPSGFRLDTIQILDMQRRLSDYDAVFFPPSDNIPMHVSHFISPYLTNYLKGGGKVYYHTQNGNIYYYGDALKKEADQAIFTAQTILLSLRWGIEKYFYYEMESGGNNFFDREDNFGLTDKNLNPKPAYHAYHTIGNLFTEGSKMDTSIAWRQGDCCVITWTQPTGARVWAVWAPDGHCKANVKIGKGFKHALNLSGAAIPEITENAATLELGHEVIYLVGPETLKIEN